LISRVLSGKLNYILVNQMKNFNYRLTRYRNIQESDDDTTATAAGAEPELEDGAVAGGEARQGAVKGLLEEVQVADDGEGDRPRRATASSTPASS
jgi:hypothetical protein